MVASSPALRKSTSPSISVVIVNWNGKEKLDRCLASLEAQTDRDFETVVVDNGSADASVKLVAERFAWVTLIETHQNLGFAEGANRGIEASRGDWIATLNNDTVADARWIERLRRAAATAGSDVGMLQSHMVLEAEPPRINSTGLLLFTNGTASDRGFGDIDLQRAYPAEIFCPTAGAALYRRAMLDRVRLGSGVFDRNYFMYFEDADLGWRCRLAGWSARYVADAVVHHAFQASSSRHGQRFVPLQCKRNRLLTLSKNASVSMLIRSSPRSLRDLWWILSRCGPRAAFATLRRSIEAFGERADVTRIVRERRVDLERAWLARH